MLMELATSPLGVLLEFVKQKVRSPSTCSTDTVSLLLYLLSPIASEEPANNDVQSDDVKLSNRANASTRGRHVKSVKTKIAAKIAIFQNTKEDTNGGLRCQDKLIVAIQVFNTASKALSEYVKKAPIRQRNGSGKKEESITQNKTESKCPLQP